MGQAPADPCKVDRGRCALHEEPLNAPLLADPVVIGEPGLRSALIWTLTLFR